MELLENILNNPQVSTAVVMLMVTGLGFLVNKIKLMQEVDTSATNERLKSIKRSSLRNEYLQIYNSKEFTYEQKYGLTRTIIAEYKSPELNGNSYIDTLEKELKDLMDDEIRQQYL